jgi:hypothetical protein
MLVVMPDKLPHPGTLAPWLHAASWSASWHPGILASWHPGTLLAPLGLDGPTPSTSNHQNQQPATANRGPRLLHHRPKTRAGRQPQKKNHASRAGCSIVGRRLNRRPWLVVPRRWPIVYLTSAAELLYLPPSCRGAGMARCRVLRAACSALCVPRSPLPIMHPRPLAAHSARLTAERCLKQGPTPFHHSHSA